LVMMFLYPLPDTSRAPGLPEVSAASSIDGCGAPTSRKKHSRHEACDLSGYPQGVRHLPMPSAGVALVASTCSSPPALASSCWGSGGGGSGSIASSLGAGGSEARVANIGSGSSNPKADEVLTKQSQI
jgi:hypothetical protein